MPCSIAKAGGLLVAFILATLPLSAAFSEKLTFSADNVSRRTAKGIESTILTGNVALNVDSMDIHADKVELYGKKDRYIKCEGKVRVVDSTKGLFIETRYLEHDRENDITRIKGFSVMEDKKNKMILKGNYIENNNKTEISIIQIGVRILKEDISCRSEYAIYDRKAKKLQLSGLPVVYKGSDIYKANIIDIDTETNDISMIGGVSGNVSTSDASPTPSTSPSGESAAPAESPSPGSPETPARPGVPPGILPETQKASPAPSTPTELFQTPPGATHHER